MFNYGASHACTDDDGWVGLSSLVEIFMSICANFLDIASTWKYVVRVCEFNSLYLDIWARFKRGF